MCSSRNLLIENGGITSGQYPFSNVTEKAVVEDLTVPTLGPMGGYRCPTDGWLNYDRAGYTDLFVAIEFMTIQDVQEARISSTETKATVHSKLLAISQTSNRIPTPTTAYRHWHLSGPTWQVTSTEKIAKRKRADRSACRHRPRGQTARLTV